MLRPVPKAALYYECGLSMCVVAGREPGLLRDGTQNNEASAFDHSATAYDMINMLVGFTESCTWCQCQHGFQRNKVITAMVIRPLQRNKINIAA